MPRRCRVVAGFEPCDESSSTDETVLLPVPLNPKPPTIASLADVSKLETDELLLVDEIPLNAEPYEDTSVGGLTWVHSGDGGERLTNVGGESSTWAGPTGAPSETWAILPVRERGREESEMDASGIISGTCAAAFAAGRTGDGGRGTRAGTGGEGAARTLTLRADCTGRQGREWDLISTSPWLSDRVGPSRREDAEGRGKRGGNARCGVSASERRQPGPAEQKGGHRSRVSFCSLSEMARLRGSGRGRTAGEARERRKEEHTQPEPPLPPAHPFQASRTSRRERTTYEQDEARDGCGDQECLETEPKADPADDGRMVESESERVAERDVVERTHGLRE